MPEPLDVAGLHLHPMQVLFLATALARLSALIPLSGVKEPNALPLGAVLNRLRLFSKVRLLDIRVLLGRKRT